MAVTINASTSAGLVTSADTSGDLNIQSGGSTKIAVTSAGAAVTGALTVNGTALTSSKILQVVNAKYGTETFFTSTSYVTSNLTATITPTSATSTILVAMSIPCTAVTTGGQLYATVFRGTVAGTTLANGAAGFGVIYNSAGSIQSIISCTVLDSPATTSATTYTVGVKLSGGSGYFNTNGATSTITLMEIAA
jgi:hypothetical protein